MKHFESETRQLLIVALFSMSFGQAARDLKNLAEVKEKANNLYLTDPKFNTIIDTITRNIIPYATTLIDRENEQAIRKNKELKREMKRMERRIERSKS